MGLVLGLDAGTQSLKGLLVDPEAGAVIARASRPLELLPGLAPGAAEQRPEDWEQAAAEVVAELLAAPARAGRAVDAVGVSGQQHGCVLLDEQGQVVRPAKLWCDTETAPEARELSARLGRSVPTGFTASKVVWVAAHEPDAWARTRQVLLPHDFLNLRLTGVASMEAGDASGTGWFDPVARAFDPQAMAAVAPELAERVPRLLEAGAPAGRVDAAGAARFGLAEGTLVSAGGGDNMMSAIGSGATRPGTAVVSLGTSGTVFAQAHQPILDPEGLIAPFCDSTGQWLPLLCVMNLTGVTEGVVGLTGQDHGALTEAARAVVPGCEGLLWLPYLAGERVPDLPDATGTLLGMRPQHLAPGVLYRAALEGTSLNLAWGVERLRGLGLPVDRVHLVGGGSRNGLWREVLAAALGAEVQALDEPESAALGAALQALWTLRRAQGSACDLHDLAAPFIQFEGEVVPPDPTLREVYGEQLEAFRAAAARVYGC
jgi:xylulokinase